MYIARKIIASLIFLGSIISMYSQSFWEELYFPDTTDIYCLTTNNQGHIFIGTGHNMNGAGIYRSLDGGISWEVVFDAGDFGINSISINSDGILYAGKTGFENFIVSYDNGDTWNPITVPYSGNIVEILHLGSDTIYLSRSVGGALLLRSPNSGQSWDSLFALPFYNEYFSRIAVTSNNSIYVSVMCWFNDLGGVYKSDDDGLTWDFCGLLNHQVKAMDINSKDDVFTGDLYTMYNEIPGIYAQYNNNDTFELIFPQTDIHDISINSNDHIYAATWGGVVVSMDDGVSFEYIDNEFSRLMRILHHDSEEYLYIANRYRLARSINPTVGIDENKINTPLNALQAYPNPALHTLTFDIENSNIKMDLSTIIIIGLSGTKMYETGCEIVSLPYTVDIGHFPSGIYVVQLSKNNRTFSTKFIKF